MDRLLNIILPVMVVVAILIFVGLALNLATCRSGHFETQRQAKGNFNHFVCDRRN